MKHSIYFFLLFCGINLYGQHDSNSMYMIKKIITKKTYYRIEATRNDSTFLILSDKWDLTDKEKVSKIEKGKSYYLDIINIDRLMPPVDGQPITYVMPYWGDVRYTDIVTPYRTIKLKLTKKYHFTAYLIKNLKGLYFSPPKEEK